MSVETLALISSERARRRGREGRLVAIDAVAPPPATVVSSCASAKLIGWECVAV